MKCPTCNEDLVFIFNSRMDEAVEKIGLCEKCKKAYREKTLGWEIIKDGAA